MTNTNTMDVIMMITFNNKKDFVPSVFAPRFTSRQRAEIFAKTNGYSTIAKLRDNGAVSYTVMSSTEMTNTFGLCAVVKPSVS